MRSALAAARLALFVGQELAQLVPGHGEEPAVKRAALRIVIQAAGGAGDGVQDDLGQVGRVGVLQAAFASELVNEWLIERGELPPRLRVARIADSYEQTGASLGRISHKAPRVITGSRPTLTPIDLIPAKNCRWLPGASSR